MVVRSLGLRACAAILFSTFMLVAGLGCHKSSSPVPAGQIQLSGYVTYTRKPLAYDTNGVPTGVATDTTTFTAGAAARGITLRVFQWRPQDQADFSTTHIWTEVASATTDDTGYYVITDGILQNWPTVVEVTSLMTEPSGHASTVAIIADPAGVYSSLNITDRPIYVIRKDLNGNTLTQTTDQTALPYSVADTVVNFSVGLTDAWTLATPKWWVPVDPTKPTTTIPNAETVSVGSSILAILDATYYFDLNYSEAVPSPGSSALDLHYRPGVSTRRGTFVEYNTLTFPQSYDGTGFHYFGSISAGGTVDGVTQPDDAYDTGVLYPLLGRNMIYAQRKTNMIPTGIPTPNLVPDVALIEGMGDGMAVTLLQSPYLAAIDPPNTGPVRSRYNPPRDIRDLSAKPTTESGAFSAPAIAALTWQLALTNTGITAPGTSTQWASIVPVNLLRFYTLLTPTLTTGNETVPSDCANLYVQLARLEEAQTSSDNSDLASYFTDGVLSTLFGGSPYNVPWTTAADADLAQYTSSWGLDPNTLLIPFPTFVLSMSQAQQIKSYYLDANGVEQVGSYYPNNSSGEVLYAMFSLSQDATYNLTINTLPALPTGAVIEVVLDGNLPEAYLFPPGSTPNVVPLTLKGNPSDLTTPVYHTVRVRILSPNVRVPDTRIAVQLEKTSS